MPLAGFAFYVVVYFFRLLGARGAVQPPGCDQCCRDERMSSWLPSSGVDLNLGGLKVKMSFTLANG